MIQKIRIENYKSIASLELELGRVNLLIGANGCGKTNLLEGIALGSAAASKKLDMEFLVSRGLRVSSALEMKSGFNKDNQETPIRIFVNSDDNRFPFSIDVEKGNLITSGGLGKLLELLSPETLTVGTRLSKAIPVLTKIYSEASLLEKNEGNTSQSNKGLIEQKEAVLEREFQALIDEFKMLKDKIAEFSPLLKTLVNAGFFDFVLYAPENHFLRRFEEENQIKPLGIRGEGLFSHLADLYRSQPQTFAEIVATVQELTDWVDGIEIPNDLIFNERRLRIRDRYLEDGLAFIDQRSSNEGFLYLLFYATLFISPATPKFFAIDNVDNALNPKLCRKLVEVLTKLAQKHGKQVIMTAHNPGILDGLNLNDPDQRLFVLSRNADGHTKALRIAQKPSSNGSSGLKLSEQFLRGLLGGLPDNF